MRALGSLLIVMLAGSLVPSAVLAGRGDELVHATLLADVAAIQPGQPFKIGALLKIDPGWHIYWSNPGDSGLPTRVRLDLPPGFTAGQVQYPIPTRTDLPGNIINYAYEDEVMLIVPVTPPKDLPARSTVTAKISWLVCSDVCLPGSATASLDVPTDARPIPAKAELFEKWTQELPASSLPTALDPNIQVQPTSASAARVTLRWKTPPLSVQWFPNSAASDITEIHVNTQRNVTTIDFQWLAAKSNPLTTIDSILVYQLPGGDRRGCQLPLKWVQMSG